MKIRFLDTERLPEIAIKVYKLFDFDVPYTDFEVQVPPPTPKQKQLDEIHELLFG